MSLLPFVLGIVFCAGLLIPLWVADRRRDARRIDDLLKLLEAQAAPAEFFALSAEPAADGPSAWLSTEDGLIVVPVDD